MLWYFIFFFISGFCSVLYELVWLRLSMAEFGVTTAMVSIVLSVFMAGLGLGSWASGAWIRRREEKIGLSPLLLYAAIELLIGVSGNPRSLRASAGTRHSGAPGLDFLRRILSGLRHLGRPHLDSLVHVDGSNHPGRHARHQASFPRRIVTVVQLFVYG